MKAIIYGAGEHGRVVLDILQEMGVDVIGFIDGVVARRQLSIQNLSEEKAGSLEDE